MKRSRSWISRVVVYLTILSIPTSLWATPIATFNATPVAKGGYAAIFRYFFTRASDGPISLNLNGIAPTFVYGITDRVALLSFFPILLSDFNPPAGGPVPPANDFGLADFQILSRTQIYRKYWVGQNLGVTILAGLEIPTGDDTFSSNSIDFPLGWTFGWQSTGNEVNVDFVYQINTEGGGVNHGDKINYDIAYSRRLLPWKLPEKGEPFIWNIVLELNGLYLNQSSLQGGGGPLADTGGHTLFITSGFEWIYHNFIIQAGAQFPLMQDLNGFQLETDFNILFNFGYAGAFF